MAPYALWGERIIIRRSGITFNLKTPTQSFYGKGYLYLTTHRCLFIKGGAIPQHKNWSSVELPLRTVTSVKDDNEFPEFKQPIFGANYLTGKSPPNSDAPFPLQDTAIWTITFKEGGCALFIKAFYALCAVIRRAAANPTNVTPDHVYNTVTHATTGFMDPTDPSVIYVHQPNTTNNGWSYNPSAQGYAPIPQNNTQQPPPGSVQQAQAQQGQQNGHNGHNGPNAPPTGPPSGFPQSGGPGYPQQNRPPSAPGEYSPPGYPPQGGPPQGGYYPPPGYPPPQPYPQYQQYPPPQGHMPPGFPVNPASSPPGYPPSGGGASGGVAPGPGALASGGVGYDPPRPPGTENWGSYRSS